MNSGLDITTGGVAPEDLQCITDAILVIFTSKNKNT